MVEYFRLVADASVVYSVPIADCSLATLAEAMQKPPDLRDRARVDADAGPTRVRFRIISFQVLEQGKDCPIVNGCVRKVLRG